MLFLNKVRRGDWVMRMRLEVGLAALVKLSFGGGVHARELSHIRIR